jgi:O-antigen/teichoic acid export membrane protein
LSSVRRSLAYTFAEGYLGIGLQLIATFFLARLLTPQETGVWAVAAVFAAIASNFRDFGVAEYLIQEKDLTEQKLRASLAANIIVSWLMAVSLLAASGWIAEFYDEWGIARVIRVQAFNFFLIPFGAVTYAYFRRELNYKPFFWVSLLSNIVSITVALACAWAGMGYMSLAWSSLSGVIVTVAFAMVVRPRGLPLMPGVAGLPAVLQFGKHATGIYFFGQIGKSAPELIIGRVLGMAPVAFFSRANGLTELFHRTVLRAAFPVCLPYFAQEARDGGDVRTGYLRAVSYLTAIGWPFFLFLAAMAFPAIRILYGSQWISSVPLAQILCVAAALEVAYILTKEVLIAQGDVRVANYLQAALQCLRVVGILAVIPFGLIGACWGLLAAALLGGIWSHRVLAKRISLTFRQLFDACASSMLITAISTAPAMLWVGLYAIDEQNYFVTFIAAGLGTFLLWLGSLRVLRHPLWTEFRNLWLRRAKRRQ